MGELDSKAEQNRDSEPENKNMSTSDEESNDSKVNEIAQVTPEEQPSKIILEDNELQVVPPLSQNKKNKLQYLKQKLKILLKSRYFRIGFPIFIVILVALFAFIPSLKYGLFNIFTSTSTSVLVVDDTTLAPVKDATIKLNGKSANTNDKGIAHLSGVSYGNVSYTVSKEAYINAKDSGKIIGSSTVLGPVKLHSNGIAVNFKANNLLSNETVKDFTISIANSNISAQSNKFGVATLKVPPYKLGKLSFQASGNGYNTSTTATNVSANQSTKPIDISLTPIGKHYFLSNQSGKIDVYSSNLDGTDPAVVIPGTGSEDNTTSLTVSPDGTHAALVSKRDKETAANGSIENALYIVDFSNKTIKRLDSGAIDMSVIGWSDNSHIIYTVDDGAFTQPNSDQFKIVNISSGQISTLYSTESPPSYYFFNEDPNHLYYLVSDDTVADYGIDSINLTTQKTQRVYDTPPDNYQLLHVKPFQATFEVNDSWYNLNLTTQEVSAGTQSIEDNDYTPSPSGSQVAWIETRNGKPSLIVANKDTNSERLVTQDPVATQIISWSDPNYIIYNSTTQDNSADYIVYVPTGVVTKISDVFVASYAGH
jgi:hypothetical protein